MSPRCPTDVPARQPALLLTFFIFLYIFIYLYIYNRKEGIPPKKIFFVKTAFGDKFLFLPPTLPPFLMSRCPKSEKIERLCGLRMGTSPFSDVQTLSPAVQNQKFFFAECRKRAIMNANKAVKAVGVCLLKRLSSS